MKVRKKGTSTDVFSTVLANTGKTVAEFFDDVSKDYKIDRLDEVADRIREAIKNNEPVTLVGDYDADGITSSAIFTILFRTLGKDLNVRLPRRFSEGYGLSESIIDEIPEGLLITVDNGITAIDAITKAKAKGLSVIVIDHHLPVDEGVLPDADIIIDPNAIPGSATFSSYCGAGLSYKLAKEMLGNNQVMNKIIALAAIGTVADVMPLVEDNRNIVRKGIFAMTSYNKKDKTSGLRALITECGLEKHMTAKNIGFKLGPCLNAPGRLNDDGAMQAYNLLSFDGDYAEAQVLAQNLAGLNETRKQLVTEYLKKVKDVVDDECLLGDCPMTVYVPGLPEGLVGIFAGRMAEEYNVPVIMLTDSDEEGVLKGSARSVGGIHLKDLLDKNSGLLVKYGGHAEAAGLSLLASNLEEFREKIQEGVDLPEHKDETIEYDFETSCDKIPEVIKELEKWGPYGEGNPEPIVLIKNIDLIPVTGGNSEFNAYARLMGEDKTHIKFRSSTNVEIMAFGSADKYRQMGCPRTINLVGYLSKNCFRDKVKNQIEVIDFEGVDSKRELTPFELELAELAKNR